MPLPVEFQFSNTNLQDYLDCPRRFELKYIKKLKWPAIKVQPVLENERRIVLGERFHHLVNQSNHGIPEEFLFASLNDNQLRTWWHNFKNSTYINSLPRHRFSEKVITTHWLGFNFIAKYDLLVVSPEQSVTIVDWKTSELRLPSNSLVKKVQSRLYPFLIAISGSILTDGITINPSKIEMVYWFSNFPDQNEHIAYSKNSLIADQLFFQQTLTEIFNTPDDHFPLTLDEHRCRFCIYRSFCNRGIKAGCLGDQAGDDLESSELISLMNFDFDQIGEIPF